jgi:5-formyltetrahydrofolate cyclo-ligase
MDSIYDEKQKIRQQIKLLKANLSFNRKAEYSLFVFEKIEKDNDFINADTIFAYWSMNDEVSTHSFIQKWSKIKDVYLPVIVGDSLELRLFEGVDKMQKDKRYGILEPKGRLLHNWESIDYAIIPGIAFDSKGNRLGRGKAFYDRILVGISAKKVGVCFYFQLIEKVPVEDTDIKMDNVFTDKFAY